MARIASSGRAARWVFVVFVVLSWPVLTPNIGQAATPSTEQIRGYTIDLRVTKDDVLHVRETIGYDFGTDRRHGIDQTIPVELRYGKHQLREFPLDQIAVSSPSHAPAQEQTLGGSTVQIQIGDPANDRITGQQTYVISYDVKAVVNSFSDHQELYWNAVGDQWAVPIDAVSATVEGPAAILKVACYQGAQRSTTPCPAAINADGSAGFSATALPAGHGMTVDASFPAGTFTHAAPILKHRWTWGEAFSLTAGTIGGSLGLFVVLAGWAIFQVLRRGRDERYLGITPGLQPNFGQQPSIGRVPWRREPVAVQFTPPAGVRPGELGALIDQRAETLHVTATVIDLAVRGYLTIEELVKSRKKQPGDWKLTRLRGRSTKELRGYESKVYGSLFRSGRVVRFSQLRKTFGEDSADIKSMLEDDVTDQGWFRDRPTKVRAKWFGFGLTTMALGLALTSVLALVSHYGLVGLAVVAAGVLLLALSRQMPGPVGSRHGHAGPKPWLPAVPGEGRGQPDPVRGGRGRLPAATCPTPSSSAWPTAGPRYSPNWPPAGRSSRFPPGTPARRPGTTRSSTWCCSTTGSTLSPAHRWIPRPRRTARSRRPPAPRVCPGWAAMVAIPAVVVEGVVAAPGKRLPAGDRGRRK